MTKVLIVHGSKRGGTAEIAEWIGAELRESGIDTDVRAAGAAPDVRIYDAVVVGGALYAGRWTRQARRFVRRTAAELVHRPVWMFSSGPLDHTAEEKRIPPPPSVAKDVRRARARGHVTFGGRLDPDARGFVVSSLAKRQGGDYRDRDEVRRWARQLAAELRQSHV